MFTNLTDGAQLTVNPNVLVDFPLGGNIRRKRRNYEAIKDDVAKNGIIQPVVARPSETSPDKLELLAGYGRRGMAKDLNIDVPVLVRLVDDKQALEIHLSENTQREDITLCDEIEFAKRYISLHHGDRSSAAKHLGWPLSKLNERLELLTCTEEVLDALDDGLIKAGHALVLAVFNETIQTNTLKKIIDEKWTVADTRARANKIQIPLDLAKFDKADCNGCAHNSQRQSGLFDFDDTQAKCSNNKCFREKNMAYMQSQRVALEERYGKVLLLSESKEQDRNTVSEIVVGSEQYKEGCAGCEKRIAVLNDSITGAAGSVIESQCTDNACFKKCTKANAAEAPKEKSTSPVKQSGAAKPEKKTINKPSNSVSQSAIDLHKAEIKVSAAAHLENNAHYRKALNVLCLAKTTGFNSTVGITELMRKTDAELDALSDEAFKHSLATSKSIGGTDVWNFMGMAACETEQGRDTIMGAWKPTKAVLEKYTTNGLEQMCVLSGFEDAVDSRDKGAFVRAKKKKGDLIKLMLEFNFDWSTFCPAALVDLLPKSLSNAVTEDAA